MTKASNKLKTRSTKYKPFYPTTLGPILHDVTFQKLPAYSIRPKPEPIDKRCKTFCSKEEEEKKNRKNLP